MHPQTSKIHPPSVLWHLATVVLLFLYGVGSFPGDSFHAIVHPKEVAALHSLENEHDACHQSLFHADAKKGCEHKTHLMSGSKCAFAQIGHQPSHIAVHPQQMHAFAIAPSPSAPIEVDFVSAFAGLLSCRAPPLG
ncbi:MAG: hypothetical protein ACKODM_08555 [Cytophagales bacterium]